MISRVYVSGPYTTPDPVENTAIAIKIGNELLDRGFAPFVPHLSHYWHTLHGARPYDDWMLIDLAWVRVADAVLRLPGDSPGADLECDEAERHSIPVFYSIPDLVKASVW